MFNMRIDIIRKELERRYQKILDLKDSSEIVIREEVNKLIYFMLSTEGIREFVIDLMNFHEKFKKTDEFNEIKINIIGCVQEIVKIIEESEFVNKGVEINLRNHFNLKGRDNLSLDEYVDCLKHFDKYFDESINDLSGMLGSGIANIFDVAKGRGWAYDSEKYQSANDNLIMWYEKLAAHLRFRFQYEGAESALNLLTIYFHSQYRYLVDIDEIHLGDDLKEAIERFRLYAHVEVIDAVNDCEELYHAVDKFLTTSKSKGFLINRLIAYCRWIRWDDFPQSKSKKRGDNEKKISKIVEEFFFNHGYFPFVHFEMGRSIPDILSIPVGDENVVRWDNSVLVELKQTIGEPYTEVKLARNIGQAKQYLVDVGSNKPDVVDTVHLLIYYDGKNPLDIEQSYRDECERDNVSIRFIYVGKETPSTIGTPKILGAPKKMVKRKSKKSLNRK